MRAFLFQLKWCFWAAFFIDLQVSPLAHKLINSALADLQSLSRSHHYFFDYPAIYSSLLYIRRSISGYIFMDCRIPANVRRQDIGFSTHTFHSQVFASVSAVPTAFLAHIPIFSPLPPCPSIFPLLLTLALYTSCQ